MSTRALLAFAVAVLAATAIALWWTRTDPGSDSEAIAPRAASERAPPATEPQGIEAPAPDAPPRDEQAPPSPEPIVAQDAPAVQEAQAESDEAKWRREAEGKTPAEMRALATARWQEMIQRADPHFDALFEAGDYEIVDEEPPLEYRSRPGDEDLILQSRADSTRMVRLVLPQEDHEDLYRELRRFHWMMDEANRVAAERERDG